MQKKVLLLGAVFAAAIAVAFAASAEYDHDLALRLMFFAGVNYCSDHSQIQSWTCPGCTLNLAGAEFIGLSDKNPQENFGFVAVDHQWKDGPLIVASFRGSSNLKNWIENLEIWYDKTVFQNLTNVRIHTGFEHGWRNMRADIHKFVGQALAKYPNATVAVTGHSLGGALSEVFGVDLATTPVFTGQPVDHAQIDYPLPVYRDVFVYNFGTPRVGDDGWAALVHTSVFGNFRLTHDRDIVPMIPPKSLGFDYFHPAREVWFPNQDPSNFRVCDANNGEDPKCIDSRLIPSFTEDHGQYLGRDVDCTCHVLKK